MIVVSGVLVLVALVLLLLGLIASSTLTLIYASIAASLLAGLFLIIAVRQRREPLPGVTPAGTGPADRAMAVAPVGGLPRIPSSTPAPPPRSSSRPQAPPPAQPLTDATQAIPKVSAPTSSPEPSGFPLWPAASAEGEPEHAGNGDTAPEVVVMHGRHARSGAHAAVRETTGVGSHAATPGEPVAVAPEPAARAAAEPTVAAPPPAPPARVLVIPPLGSPTAGPGAAAPDEQAAERSVDQPLPPTAEQPPTALLRQVAPAPPVEEAPPPAEEARPWAEEPATKATVADEAAAPPEEPATTGAVADEAAAPADEAAAPADEPVPMPTADEAAPPPVAAGEPAPTSVAPESPPAVVTEPAIVDRPVPVDAVDRPRPAPEPVPPVASQVVWPAPRPAPPAAPLPPVGPPLRAAASSSSPPVPKRPAGGATSRLRAGRAADHPAAPDGIETAQPAESAVAQPDVVASERRFHRPECRYAENLQGAQRLSRTAALAAGLQACGVCKP